MFASSGTAPSSVLHALLGPVIRPVKQSWPGDECSPDPAKVYNFQCGNQFNDGMNWYDFNWLSLVSLDATEVGPSSTLDVGPHIELKRWVAGRAPKKYDFHGKIAFVGQSSLTYMSRSDVEYASIDVAVWDPVRRPDGTVRGLLRLAGQNPAVGSFHIRRGLIGYEGTTAPRALGDDGEGDTGFAHATFLQMNLFSNAAGAAPGPITRSYRHNTPAIGNEIGINYFAGDNDTGAGLDYAAISVRTLAVAAGAESSEFVFRVMESGTLVEKPLATLAAFDALTARVEALEASP